MGGGGGGMQHLLDQFELLTAQGHAAAASNQRLEGQLMAHQQALQAARSRSVSPVKRQSTKRIPRLDGLLKAPAPLSAPTAQAPTVAPSAGTRMSSSAAANRGSCLVCGQHVLMTQQRVKSPQGYRHQKCHELEADSPISLY